MEHSNSLADVAANEHLDKTSKKPSRLIRWVLGVIVIAMILLGFITWVREVPPPVVGVHVVNLNVMPVDNGAAHISAILEVHNNDKSRILFATDLQARVMSHEKNVSLYNHTEDFTLRAGSKRYVRLSSTMVPLFNESDPSITLGMIVSIRGTASSLGSGSSLKDEPDKTNEVPIRYLFYCNQITSIADEVEPKVYTYEDKEGVPCEGSYVD